MSAPRGPMTGTGRCDLLIRGDITKETDGNLRLTGDTIEFLANSGDKGEGGQPVERIAGVEGDIELRFEAKHDVDEIDRHHAEVLDENCVRSHLGDGHLEHIGDRLADPGNDGIVGGVHRRALLRH